MEKFDSKLAEQLFADVDEAFKDYSVVDFGVSLTPVKIYKNISMVDLNTIVKIVIGTAFEDGEYNHVVREATIALCVIKYLTDIPMPTLKSGDEEVDDIPKAFQIVFGDNGLYDKRKPSFWIINKIENYVDRNLEFAKEKYTPIGNLCTRAMELGQELSAAIEQALDSPELAELTAVTKDAVGVQN